MKHNNLKGKHHGYDKEPKTGVDDLTEEELQHINQRWEEFYHKHKGFLRHYAYGDEDLVSIGILSARETLAKHPNCPESWLVHRTKLNINTARASGNRVYLSLDSDNDKQWVNDALQYEAMTTYEQIPEILYQDQVKFNRLLSRSTTFMAPTKGIPGVGDTNKESITRLYRKGLWWQIWIIRSSHFLSA